MKNDEHKTPLTHYILPTSSNLLGICFFILTYIKMSDKSAGTLLDECIIIPIILFFISCVLSYIGMRTDKTKPRIEKYADFVFMAGLLALSVIAVVLVLEYI